MSNIKLLLISWVNILQLFTILKSFIVYFPLFYKLSTTYFPVHQVYSKTINNPEVFKYFFLPITTSSHVKCTRRARFMWLQANFGTWCLRLEQWTWENMALGDGKQDPKELLHNVNLEEPQGHVRQLMSICVRSRFSILASVPFALLPNSQVQERNGEGVN